MESKVKEIGLKKANEILWFLEHDHIYTQGTSTRTDEIIPWEGESPFYASNIIFKYQAMNYFWLGYDFFKIKRLIIIAKIIIIIDPVITGLIK